MFGCRCWLGLYCLRVFFFNILGEYEIFGGWRREMFCIFVMGVWCVLGLIFLDWGSCFEGEKRIGCEG